jgi:hypothetical protein
LDTHTYYIHVMPPLCKGQGNSGRLTIVHYHDHYKNIGLPLFWWCGILLYVCWTDVIKIFLFYMFSYVFTFLLRRKFLLNQ